MAKSSIPSFFRASPWSFFCPVILGFSVALGACSYAPRVITEYRIDVQQGNVLTQEMVAQLRPGLSREQVRFILGAPVLTDLFHGERWEYVFRLQEGKNNATTRRRLSVFFDAEGHLTHVAGDVVAGEATELTTPPVRTQVVDLGNIGEDAPPLPPPEAEKGIFGRFLESLGW
ncbi:MAG: outer membrane protein assembly factor BamE [Zoogloeaceae bacterium]|jgi:outer membrane protein assembly factor BamE|nr:outer membrane protein assembly factor BamE [Zoogloeaceae bacterium]